MVAPEGSSAPQAAPMRSGVAVLLDAVSTRLELAAVELAEQRVALTQQALYSVMAVLCGALAAVLLVVALVLAAPESQRLAVVGLLAALALACTAACGWRLRAMARRRPPLLQSTLEVLRADAAALRPQHRVD